MKENTNQAFKAVMFRFTVPEGYVPKGSRLIVPNKDVAAKQRQRAFDAGQPSRAEIGRLRPGVSDTGDIALDGTQGSTGGFGTAYAFFLEAGFVVNSVHHEERDPSGSGKRRFRVTVSMANTKHPEKTQEHAIDIQGETAKGLARLLNGVSGQAILWVNKIEETMTFNANDMSFDDRTPNIIIDTDREATQIVFRVGTPRVKKEKKTAPAVA